jgi:hypothetical protein
VGIEHNALSYGVALSRAAARASGMSEGELGLARLGETLTPILNLWALPEWALLRGERTWAIAPSIGATVAEFSAVGIRNPADSGLIVVVARIVAFVTTTTISLEGRMRASAVVDATSTPNSLDTRVPILTGIQCVSLADSNAAKQGSILFAWQQSNLVGQSAIQTDVVLSPGFDFFVGPAATNAAIQCSFFGRERQAFPGELQTRG